MHNLLGLLLGITTFLGGLFGTPAALGATIFQPIQGGTGSSTLSGILIGNGTSPVQTLTVGSNLTLTGTTLSATGGGSSTFGTTSISATYPLAWNTSTANLSTVATSSLNLLVGSFLSPNISQWTNDSSYVTSSFSTTSADFYKTQRNFFATSSADYHLAATTSVKSITTLSSLSLPYSQLTGTPVIASSTLLSDFNTFTNTQRFSTASTTNLIVSSAGGTGSRCAQFATDGTISATAGACGVAGTGIQNIGPTGQTQSGTTQTLATSSATTISGLTVGLKITAAGDVQTFTPTFSGSISGLTTSNLASPNISQFTNDSGYVTSSFSTTSANFWATLGLAFSTTSSDYWKTQRDFFSTTSASYFSSLGLAFSTTSSNYWETQQAKRFDFTPTTAFTGANNNATGTLIGFNAGLYSLASSTIGAGGTLTGLSISGNSTTTGDAYHVGRLRIGTTTVAVDQQPWVAIDAGTTASEEVFTMTGNTNDFIEANIQNKNAGASAQACQTATGDTGTLTTGFVSLCANSSTFWNPQTYNVGGPGDTSIMGLQTNDLYITQATSGKKLHFLNGGTSTSTNEYETVSGTSVGIGTTSPFAQFSIGTRLGATGSILNLFAVASSSATATTTLFDITNKGTIGVASTSPWAKFSISPVTGEANAALFAIGSTSLTTFLVNNLGHVGIASTSPWGSFSISPVTGDTNSVLFALGSSTLTTFIANNLGRVGIGTTSPFASFTVMASTTASSTGSIVSSENVLATSTSLMIDWRGGNQQLVRIGNAAMTISFVPGSMIPGMTLRLVTCSPPAGTAGAITWSPTIPVMWAGGSAPSQTTTANVCDMESFVATYATTTQVASPSVIIFGAASAGFQ